MDQYDNVLFINRKPLFNGKNCFEASLKGNTLIPNVYKLSVAIDSPGIEVYDIIDNGLKFEIIDTGNTLTINGDTENGIIVSPLIWK